MLNQRLIDMLSFKRPHGSQTEIDWATHFIMPYGPELFGDEDTMAYAVTVGTDSPVLFSAHTDTVHRTEGPQSLCYDKPAHCIVKDDNEPLGADDAAGCWLLLEMIDAGVPGTYLFHRGEEQGGIGSKWMATYMKDWLATFDYAIAFDRKATHSIITHQGYGMCCSQTFAESLAASLNTLNDDFMYSPDNTGVYTDTAEYTDIIAECTNVSCGYYDEHTPRERLDVEHLDALRAACIALDWSLLPVTRKPGEDDYMPVFKKRGSSFRTSYALDYELSELSVEEMRDAAHDDPTGFADMVFMELNGYVPRDEDNYDRAYGRAM